jgi:hypothetical protein
MPGHPDTPAKYAPQRVVKSFGNLLFELAEHRLTHTCAVLFRLYQLQEYRLPGAEISQQRCFTL